MKKKLHLFLAALLFPLGAFSQAANWSPGANAPYFRHVNAVDILPTGRIITAGGNPTNDAITSLFYSDDSAATWLIATDMVNAMMNDVHFPDQFTGYAVGNSGKIFKTTNSGTSWSPLVLTGSIANRHFNGVHFFNANTGVAVGGNKSNDAIQTIIRTTDGGQNWSVITDNLGAWLLDVFFVDANTGFAVGEQGKVLKTTDGGSSWSVIPVTGNLSSRQFHDLHFFDAQTGIIVGGFPANDSIQTIIKTTDGGQTWNIVKDNLASMLKTVHFLSSTEGYAGGNDGVLLHTTNQGQSWTPLTVAGNSTDAINDIDFLNQAYGAAGGRFGKVLVYKDAAVSTPTATISAPVTIVNANTVQINGQVNANGNATAIEFEYGTTPSLGNAAAMSPASTTNNLQPVSLTLTGLQPGSVYFGRIKASNTVGVAYSPVVQFYTNLNAIPNFNFENWNNFSTEGLQSWNTAGQIEKVSSYNGSFAAKAQATNSQEPGAILYADVDNNGIQPLPYAGRPDTVSFYANYSIAANDSALVVLMLKSNGATVADIMHKIGGSSGGQFVQIKIPVAYTSAAIPDSMALLFISTNFFSGTISTQSQLTIDNVELKGTTAQLPNSNMESWLISTRNAAAGWWSQDDMNYQPGDSALVRRTTDAYSGEYALLLRNNTTTSQFGYITTGEGFGMPNPDFSVQFRHSTFNGYYKFSPDNGDTLFVSATFFRQGNQVGYAYQPITQLANQFTLFSLPISYFNADVPDSAQISFGIRKGHGMQSPGNSWAILDNLSFDGIAQPLAVEGQPEPEKGHLLVYPNPAGHEVNIVLDAKGLVGSAPIRYTVYDLTGRVQLTRTYHTLPETAKLDISRLSSQVYFVVVEAGNKVFVTKFIKGL